MVYCEVASSIPAAPHFLSANLMVGEKSRVFMKQKGSNAPHNPNQSFWPSGKAMWT
jgi:hypothetical protein